MLKAVVRRGVLPIVLWGMAIGCLAFTCAGLMLGSSRWAIPVGIAFIGATTALGVVGGALFRPSTNAWEGIVRLATIATLCVAVPLFVVSMAVQDSSNQAECSSPNAPCDTATGLGVMAALPVVFLFFFSLVAAGRGIANAVQTLRHRFDPLRAQ